MSNPFSLTLRSIQADGLRRVGLAAAFGAVVLGAWGVWFFGASLTVYAPSRAARLEVLGRPAPLLAERAGRVSAVHAAVGDEVQEGQVILELDAEATLLELDEARAREQALSARLEALRAELASSSSAADREGAVSEADVAAAVADAEAARARAGQARAEADRAERLFADGHLSAAERERSSAEAASAEATARALESAAAQARQLGAQRSADRVGAVASIQGELDALQGEAEAAWARVSRLELEIERAQIRAPQTGRLAELAAVAVGGWITAGDALGAVVPEGRLQIVADFAPADALGRVRPGQEARMRLDGFPWTRFGTLRATVARVSEEPRDGLIRVELDPTPDPRSALPLRHALGGTVEVAVERLSPADLVLRAAGRALDGPAGEAPQ